MPAKPKPPPTWLSISAYARAYGIDRVTVYKWLDAKLLETYRQGGCRRIKNVRPDQHIQHTS